MTERKQNWQGMKWCRTSTRLSIYLRDGLACVYCGEGIEHDVKFTLDHLKPHSKGGSNEPTNLVTCCIRCNASRSNRPLVTFIRGVADYTGQTSKSIMNHVRACAKRTLPRKEARDILARRKNLTGAMIELSK